MRVARDLREFCKRRLVLILRAEIDFDNHILLFKRLPDLGIRLKQLVELVAPTAPIPANIDQNPLLLFGRQLQTSRKVSRCVPRRIENLLLCSADLNGASLGKRAANNGEENNARGKSHV